MEKQHLNLLLQPIGEMLRSQADSCYEQGSVREADIFSKYANRVAESANLLHKKDNTIKPQVAVSGGG